MQSYNICTQHIKNLQHQIKHNIQIQHIKDLVNYLFLLFMRSFKRRKLEVNMGIPELKQQVVTVSSTVMVDTNHHHNREWP